MVDRVKPWFMVNGLAHGSRIMVLFMVWFMVQFMVWFLVHGSWFMVSFLKFFLNMVDYPVFFSCEEAALEVHMLVSVSKQIQHLVMHL